MKERRRMAPTALMHSLGDERKAMHRYSPPRRRYRQAGLYAVALGLLMLVWTVWVSATSTSTENVSVEQVQTLASELHEARNVIDEHLGFGRDSR